MNQYSKYTDIGNVEYVHTNIFQDKNNEIFRNFNSLLDVTFEEEYNYIKEFKNFITRRCTEQPSIALLLQLYFNNYNASLKGNIDDKLYYMCEAMHKFMHYLIEKAVKIDGKYDYLLDEVKYHSYNLQAMAKFISVFFGNSKDCEDDSKIIHVKFCYEYKDDKVIFYDVSSTYGNYGNYYYKGYTKNPDDWVAFFEKYAEEKIKENQ